MSVELVIVRETNVAGLREVVRRLAIFSEWQISPPPQRWCPEAEQYDVAQLVRDMLDDEKVREAMIDKGLGRWLFAALVGEESATRLWIS